MQLWQVCLTCMHQQLLSVEHCAFHRALGAYQCTAVLLSKPCARRGLHRCSRLGGLWVGKCILYVLSVYQ